MSGEGEIRTGSPDTVRHRILDCLGPISAPIWFSMMFDAHSHVVVNRVFGPWRDVSERLEVRLHRRHRPIVRQPALVQQHQAVELAEDLVEGSSTRSHISAARKGRARLPASVELAPPLTL